MDEVDHNPWKSDYYGIVLSKKFPFLRPILLFLKKVFFSKPRFSGWGMTTVHENAWDSDVDEDVFNKASQDIKNHFQFKSLSIGINSKNIDTLLWRHWFVSYAVRHAIKFAQTNEHNFVECGVAEGITAFFALREILAQKDTLKKFSMHLYDSWGVAREEDLLKGEVESKGKYEELDISLTKRNLSEFNDYVVYHHGYIPQSFSDPPDSPKSISYLHTDLVLTKPTISTLEFFYPRLVSGGVILLDTYGYGRHSNYKKVVDKFFQGKSGMFLKLPTGQAIYFKR